jgi:hypothetical protein
VPPPSRLEVDDGEHRLCSVPTPPLPRLCSTRRGQGASLRPPKSRGRGHMARCGPSRRCCWPRIDPAAARPPGKERRWSRIGAGRLSRWRSCWPASCAEESRRGERVGRVGPRRVGSGAVGMQRPQDCATGRGCCILQQRMQQLLEPLQ